MNIPRAEELATETAVNKCVAESESQEQRATNRRDIYLEITRACQIFRLAEQLLLGAGTSPTPSSFITAVETIGSFSLPGLAEVSLSPTKHGAANLLRRFAYDPDLGHLIAIGQPISILELS